MVSKVGSLKCRSCFRGCKRASLSICVALLAIIFLNHVRYDRLRRHIYISWSRMLDLAIYSRCKNNDIAVGVVASLEKKYLDLSRTIMETWGREFEMIKIFVPERLDKKIIQDDELQSIMVYALERVDLSMISSQTSPGFHDKKHAWKIAQHMFLEASRHLVEEYPDTAWYLLVDADTMIYRKCLVNFLSHMDPYAGSLALGSVIYRDDMRDSSGMPLMQKTSGDAGSLMGGSGTVWSNRAGKKMDFSFCISQTLSNGPWEAMNSDWRMTRCFDHFSVPVIPIFGMYQFLESAEEYQESAEPQCRETGRHYPPPCALSKHYMTVENLRTEYSKYKSTYG